MKNMPLKAQILMILMAGLVPFLLVLIFTYFNVSNTLTDYHLTNAQTYLTGRTTTLANKLKSKSLLLSSISQADVFETQNKDAIAQYIREVAESDNQVMGLEILDLDGAVIATSFDQSITQNRSEKGSDDFDRLFYKPISGTQGQVFQGQFDVLEGKLGWSMATPITDDSNRLVLGALIMVFDANQLLGDMLVDLPPGINISVVTNQGAVIYTTDSGVSIHETHPFYLTSRSLRATLTSSLITSPVVALGAREYQGKSVQAFVNQLNVDRNQSSNLIWLIATVEDLSATQLLRLITLPILVVLVVIFPVVLWALIQFTNKALSPLQRLKKELEIMQQSSEPVAIDEGHYGPEWREFVFAFNGLQSQIQSRQALFSRTYNLLLDVFNANTDAIVVLDDNGRITDLNLTAKQLFHMTETTEFPLDLINIPDEAGLVTIVKNAVHSPSEHFSTTLTSSDGMQRQTWRAAFVGRSISTLGEPLTFIHIEDRTALLAAENLKWGIINATAHEFRTPITSIRGYARLLVENGGAFSEDVKLQGLQTILSGAERLSDLLTDFLYLAEHNVLTGIEKRQVDMNCEEFVVTLNRRFAKTFQDREIYVTAQSGIRRFYMDFDSLCYALQHLVSNAVKFSPIETPILVDMREVDGQWEISVIDYGIGIREDATGKLVESFEREDQSDTGAQGIGVGLTVVNTILTAHDSQLQLERLEHVGTRASFKLKLEA